MSDRKTPYGMDEKAGQKAICRCGKSANKPHCDGNHKGSGITPAVVKLESDGRVFWCGCGQSVKFPFCDGTHRRL